VSIRTGAGLFDRTLERLRKICLPLPEVEEVPSWGHPNFRAGRKHFATLEEYHGTLCICFRMNLTARECVLGDERFFLPPHAAGGWVCMKVTARMEWSMIEALVLESYRLVALRRMLRALDEGTVAPARRTGSPSLARRSPGKARGR